MSSLSCESLSDADRNALARIDGLGPDLTEQTVKWARTNTGSWNADGLKALAPVIAQRFKALDAEVRLRPLDPFEIVDGRGEAGKVETGPLIEVTARPHAPVQVVMTGHYDTVFPPGRFEAISEVEPGRLNGPGLTDMKGGLATMCAALEVFEAGALKDTLGYRIAITPDEEIGNPASANALREAARRGPGAQVGMTYEPALEDGGLAGARKGSGNFSLVIRGRAAHAGRAHHEGRSAILAASRFVVGLEGLNGQRDGVTFNAAKVEGGAPNNQVPDIAVVRFNARIPDSDAQGWAEAEIGSLCDMVNSLDGITADLHGSFYRPAKPFNAAQQALFEGVRDTGRAIGLDLHWTPTGGVCEGNNIFAAGVPNIDTLGVRGGAIHSTGEFLLTDSFEERVALSVLILNRLADGRLDAAHIKSLMGS